MDERKREYCENCGEIVVKEPSVYFPNIMNTMCYACHTWNSSSTCEDEEEVRKKCSEYYMLVFKPKPVTSAELPKHRRKKKPNPK